METPLIINVRSAVRRRILFEIPAQAPSAAGGGILDDVCAIMPGFRGIAAFGTTALAILGLGWSVADVFGEISLAIQLQLQFITGL